MEVYQRIEHDVHLIESDLHGDIVRREESPKEHLHSLKIIELRRYSKEED